MEEQVEEISINPKRTLTPSQIFRNASSWVFCTYGEETANSVKRNEEIRHHLPLLPQKNQVDDDHNEEDEDRTKRTKKRRKRTRRTRRGYSSAWKPIRPLSSLTFFIFPLIFSLEQESTALHGIGRQKGKMVN